MTAIAAEACVRRAATGVSRLLVTVRDRETHAYRPVGFLTHQDDFEFAYLRQERVRPDFRPLPGLARAADGAIHSDVLFPVFAERVISSRRPDREVSMSALGLPLDAAPFEVLTRSHGQSAGDTIELLPAPAAGFGEQVSFTFLAHGVRYLAVGEQERIASLRQHETLQLHSDPDNPVNARALLVTDTDQVRLGWVPDPLLDVMRSLRDWTLSVERANDPGVGFHFRLLVRFSGVVSNRQGLFAGPTWDTYEGPD